MTIELPTVNNFKKASFPGKWTEDKNDGTEVTLKSGGVYGIIPGQELKDFYKELQEMATKADELLNEEKRKKSVEELQKGRDEIILYFDTDVKPRYSKYGYEQMIEQGNSVKEQIKDKLNAVIKEKEKAIQDVDAAKKRKEDELKKKSRDEKAKIDRQVKEYYKKAKEAAALKKKLYDPDTGRLFLKGEISPPTDDIERFKGMLDDIEKIPNEIKEKALEFEYNDFHDPIYEIMHYDISDIYKLFRIKPPKQDAIVPQTRSQEEEIKQVKNLGLVTGNREKFVVDEGKSTGDSSTPKKPDTKCPCDSIKGGGKNKRKKNTKNKRKKNTKNKRKKYTKNKRKKNTKNKRKKYTKNKSKKYTKKKKSTKRKNVKKE
tara:strand:- start:2832 stop:3953 length:1122 start_codon:yes stop_codon:yes gene_type:complete